MNRADSKAAAAGLAALNPDAAFRSGLALLSADVPELLLPSARLLSNRHRNDPRMAQLLGLAARAAGDGPLAAEAFGAAARLAPQDPLIAHSRARTALEAGHAASAHFETARRLAPNDGSVIQGHAAALVAEGRASEADAMLASLLGTNPLWLDGHETLAKIRGQYGGNPVGSIDAAIRRLPTNGDLYRLRVSTLLTARRTSDAQSALAAAERSLGQTDWTASFGAHIASELGQIPQADAAYSALPPPADSDAAALFARHEIKAGRPERAAAIVEPWLSDEVGAVWPYASLAWRLTGDARADWLEGDEALIGVYDLADRIGDLGELAEQLRALHIAQSPPLDQSVRGGTQTDGHLLQRAEPVFQNLRAELLLAVGGYVAALPTCRSGHPTLVARREPLRFSGAWSVRLRDAGFHADHVHSHGWLSSAFYVSLPETTGEEGWLSLGECRELVPDLSPRRLVEPKPGRLVLFPSTMWHGTRPFAAGERLTVAFDIARPRQD